MASRRRDTKVVLLAVCIVAITTVDAYVLLMRGRATPVSVTSAVERYRAAEDEERVDPSAPAGSADTVASAPESTVPQPDPTSRPTRSGAPAANAAPKTAGPATAAPTASPLIPPKGVYVYKTKGYEEVSLASARRTYPDETTRTIEHLGGCQWSSRTTLLEEHEEFHYACSTADKLEITRSRSALEWYGRREESEYQCSPPQRLLDLRASRGAVAPFTCRDRDVTTIDGTVTYVGEESFAVAGSARPASRIRVQSKFSGKMRGTIDAEQVIDRETGVLLWQSRHDELQDDSPVGRIDYTQEVTVTLTSLTPRT